MWAKQSTAATLIVGPILDSTGAEYTSAVIGDLSISKNGGTLTALASAATLTHIANGQYTLVMTTGNLDTLGRLQITCNKSTYQMPPIGLNIVPADRYDSLVLGTDRFDANVTHVADTSQTAGDLYASQVAIAGYIDTEVGAIKAKTDQLTFTTANKVDSTAVLDPAVETAIESAAADAATLVTRLTSQRAANLDNLDVAISVVQSQITALNNLSAKANWFGSLLLEVPDSGTRDYVFELVVKDDEDKLVNLDGSPTIALVNASGTDRSSLITTAIANPSTGRYTLTITVGTGTVNESLKLTASGTVSAEARYAVIAPQVVDYDNATQVALLLTRLGTPSVSVSADIAAVSTKLGTPAGASVSADIASIKTDTGTTIPGLFTTLTTKIRKFFQLSLRKDAAIATDNATELTELNANGGSGGGGYLNTTDSQEATVDRGNVAWITGGGGGGDATLSKQEEILLAVDSVADTVAAYAARMALEVQLRGFPNVICRNADYLEATESEIRITVEDLTGAAITEIAGTPVASLSWLFGMGTEQTPALIAGTCTWDSDSDELVIEIAKEATASKQTGSLTWQIGVTIDTKKRWLGGGTTRLIERQF